MRSCILGALAFIALGQLRAQPKTATAPTTHVEYKVVESRAAMRIVVIKPQDRTEAKLRALGRNLKAVFASLPVVIVMVFDNEQAAKMYDRMSASGGSLGGTDDAFYDRHTVANYSHNKNTRHEQYSYFPDGGNGRQIDVVP